MLRTFDATLLKECQVEGEKSSCLIPLVPEVSLDLDVRCEREVQVSMVTEDGQTIPMQNGKIVKMRGTNRNFQAIEILSDTNFWYRCLLSRNDEEVDPVPVQVELIQTPQDVLKNLIDERLRRWKAAQELERDLTEEESEELILDIARGDLEFDVPPDEFGLGYEERLEEFAQRTAEQDAAAAAGAADTAPAGSSDDAPPPPAEGANSSST